jgi:hypothetical protein
LEPPSRRGRWPPAAIEDTSFAEVKPVPSEGLCVAALIKRWMAQTGGVCVTALTRRFGMSTTDRSNAAKTIQVTPAPLIREGIAHVNVSPNA